MNSEQQFDSLNKRRGDYLELSAGKYSFSLGERAYVMGILNITPDSFSDGGKYFDADAAVCRALELEEQGADIIDIGAQSTRPGSARISADDEVSRLLPVLKKLNGKLKTPVSVDTFYPMVAELALINGAEIINDVSGTFNAGTAALCKKYSAGYIVMHNGGVDNEPIYERGIFTEVGEFFDDVLRKCDLAGLDRRHLCLDVGIGFGKSYNDNLALLCKPESVRRGGVALMVGASRKRTVGAATGVDEPSERVSGSIAAHTAAILGGADIIRVHDVRQSVEAAKMAWKIKKYEER